LVGINDCIQLPDVGAQHLLTKVRTAVNNERFSMNLNPDGGSEAFIMKIS